MIGSFCESVNNLSGTPRLLPFKRVCHVECGHLETCKTLNPVSGPGDVGVYMQSKGIRVCVRICGILGIR